MFVFFEIKEACTIVPITARTKWIEQQTAHCLQVPGIKVISRRGIPTAGVSLCPRSMKAVYRRADNVTTAGGDVTAEFHRRTSSYPMPSCRRLTHENGCETRRAVM